MSVSYPLLREPFVPETYEELAEFVREHGGIVTRTHGHRFWGLPIPYAYFYEVDRYRRNLEISRTRQDEFGESMWSEGSEWVDPIARRLLEEGHDPHAYHPIDLSGLKGIVDYEVSDQVVVVRAGTWIEQLQSVLKENGQSLPYYQWPIVDPYGDEHLDDLYYGPVHALVDLNLPHVLEAQHGRWTDWILGMKVVLADGTIASSGSKAVKNVAGYDIHKLFVGARGTLGIVVELTLRTHPWKALASPDVLNLREPGGYMGRPNWVQRTKPSDFADAVEQAAEWLTCADQASSTLYARIGSTDGPHGEHDPERPTDLPRYPGDWVLRAESAEKNLEIKDPTLIRLMRRAKEVFDPTGKLNPGEVGIF